MTETTESTKDNCLCCPNEFHIHVDFVKFAEEQLSVNTNTADRKNGLRDKLGCTTRKSSNSFLQKSKIFVEGASQDNCKNVENSKVKHMKRESLLIHQKILKLQTCTPKTNEEIYGQDLLKAIKEFDDFVAKSWGNGESSRLHRNVASSQQDYKSLPICNSVNSTSSVGVIAGDEETGSSCPEEEVVSRTSLNDALKSNDACTFCQRKCPCKTTTAHIGLDNDDNSSLTLDSTSKGVNTEVITQTTSTNTVVDVTVETIPARLEHLSKLTIHAKSPSMQLPDQDGEGNISVPTTAEVKYEEPEMLPEVKGLTKINSPSEGNVVLEDDHAEKCPSDDMKAGLKIVNDVLLHGRTGRDVAASMSVILNDWFMIAGAKTACVNNIVNYLRTFESYSPQLLRYIVNIPDTSGITALHYAVSYGNYAVVSKLLDTNVIDPNKANKAGYTSIMLASLAEIATESEEQVIRKLISLADVNIKAAQHGQTALMLAASNGRFKMVKLLLEAGAEVNAQDEDGSTALMCASEHGHVDIVQCLLAQPGCDPNIIDNDGLTALNVAMQANHKDVAVLLYAHMHFVSKLNEIPASSDNTLLLPKRSRSTMNTPVHQQSNSSNTGDKIDVHFVARKQHSSIN